MAEVIWEGEVIALRKYVLFYGSLKFSELSANKLNGKFKKYSRLLESNPRLGKRIEVEGLEQHEIRSVLVHECYRLYYVIESNAESEVVRVIDLVDTRSNPEILPERLKMQLETKFSLT